MYILFRNDVNFSLDKKIFEYRNTIINTHTHTQTQKNTRRKNLKINQFYRRSESVVVYQRCYLKGYLERN